MFDLYSEPHLDHFEIYSVEFMTRAEFEGTHDILDFDKACKILHSLLYIEFRLDFTAELESTFEVLVFGSFNMLDRDREWKPTRKNFSLAFAFSMLQTTASSRCRINRAQA